MDLLGEVKKYLKENINNLNADIVSPLLSKDSKSIAIRTTPSSSNSRYLEGKTINISFQILVKDPSNMMAYNILYEIAKTLDGITKEQIPNTDGSYELINCECNTFPRFVEETANQEYIYTSLFVAEINIL